LSEFLGGCAPGGKRRYEDIMAVQKPEKLMEKLLNDFEFLQKGGEKIRYEHKN